MTNEKMVKITNRSDSRVTYQIPEMKIVRRFVKGESKTVPYAELQALANLDGGLTILTDFLRIEDEAVINELIYNVQPEYYYTAAEVKALLTHGSEDQLLDALDFAPEGVIEMIKNEAVKSKLNDVRKRDIILQKTGFNVTKAIEANAESEKVVAAPTARRSAPISAEPTYATLSASAETEPVRRTAPRYSVNVKND